MTTHRVINWTLATVIAIGMASAYHLDGPDDHSAEMAQSQALSDAQQQAQREFRRDMAAAELCRQQHGESGISWTEAGALVCLPRKGRAVAFKGAGL